MNLNQYNSQISYNYLSIIMQKLTQSNPHCTYNNLAYHVCSNPNCTFNPFICQDSCQCKSHHIQCEKINWQYIKEKLNCSTVKKNPTFESFTNNVESLYQNIIKQVTKAYEDFIEWKNNFGFTAKESQFLKLIEEKRYNQITGSDIAVISKQIRTPSKIIMKTQRQIKEKVLMINSYVQSMLLQFSELYSKNKVVKVNTQKSNIENIDENENENNIEQINQNKINLVHRLLGLNEKGSRFLMMLNENAIETKLQKLIEKVNSNEGTIMKALDLKIEQLRQNIKDQKKQITQSRNEIKKEISQTKSELKTDICQLRNETKTQSNDIKKEVTQLQNETKIQYNDIKKELTQIRNEDKTQSDDIKKELTDMKNYREILTQQIIIKTKLNNKKSKVIQNIQLTFATAKKQFPFFSQSLLKMYSSELLNKIQDKVPSILRNHIDNKLSAEKLRQQFISIQKQAELIRKQFDLMSKNFDTLKINAISFLFSKKIAKLNLLYRASQNNFQAYKFHDKCDGRQHTITILKTQFGNVIGGYTPLAWNKNKNYKYQADNNMQSFIFSLTNKHKLTLIEGKQDKAIYHNSIYGPVFGNGCDMAICDKANQNNGSYGNPGNTYNYNNEYVYDSQQSYKKWSGQSSGRSFNILQWQVYSIVFG